MGYGVDCFDEEGDGEGGFGWIEVQLQVVEYGVDFELVVEYVVFDVVVVWVVVQFVYVCFCDLDVYGGGQYVVVEFLWVGVDQCGGGIEFGVFFCDQGVGGVDLCLCLLLGGVFQYVFEDQGLQQVEGCQVQSVEEYEGLCWMGVLVFWREEYLLEYDDVGQEQEGCY